VFCSHVGSSSGDNILHPNQQYFVVCPLCRLRASIAAESAGAAGSFRKAARWLAVASATVSLLVAEPDPLRQTHSRSHRCFGDSQTLSRRARPITPDSQPQSSKCLTTASRSLMIVLSDWQRSDSSHILEPVTSLRLMPETKMMAGKVRLRLGLRCCSQKNP
jgi:hypothetical protein